MHNDYPDSSAYPMLKPYLRMLTLELDEQYLMDRIILECGVWELHVVLYIHQYVKPGFVCVDVGANAGYITLPMADRCGPDGKVIAFEPNAEIRGKLERNIALNPELAALIDVRPQGLSVEHKVLFVHCDKGFGLGNATLSDSPDSDNQDVEVITLDSLNLDRLDFLKIDVEGMELDVMRGAAQTIDRCQPFIVFETLTALPPEQHKPCEDFLAEHGYLLYCIDIDREILQQVKYPDYPQEDLLAIPLSRVEEVVTTRSRHLEL